MSAPFRFPRFFVTNPSPCPYLPGKVERKVFTELTGRNASELNEALGRIGFRRSQSVAYRPSCVGFPVWPCDPGLVRAGLGHSAPSTRARSRSSSRRSAR